MYSVQSVGVIERVWNSELGTRDSKSLEYLVEEALESCKAFCRTGCEPIHLKTASEVATASSGAASSGAATSPSGAATASSEGCESDNDDLSNVPPAYELSVERTFVVARFPCDNESVVTASTADAPNPTHARPNALF